jgi:BirA family biotin operon repressor/biotin-[acetyl-CoA-carboxylase] ligase
MPQAPPPSRSSKVIDRARGLAALYTVEHHAAVGSTNDLAMAAAMAGRHGHWITATEQLSGRGRHGRVWASVPGNLYASLALCDPCPVRDAPQLGFVAGVALHKAVTELIGTGPDREPKAALKWPNDLLLDGAKIAGILLEGRSAPSGALSVVIGIGVNLCSHPADTPYAATDLGAAGFDVTGMDLFSVLRERMADEIAAWNGGADFAAIRRAWLERAHGRGTMLTVRRSSGDIRGTFSDIDATGRLVIACDSGMAVIDAGDVFFETLKQ